MKATLIFFMILLTGGCVSVNLGTSRTHRAEGVRYSEPKSPFVKQDLDAVDAAWKNPRNGAVISYLSECQDPLDPPLDQIVSGVLNGLSQLRVEQEETLTFQEREARRVRAEGRVDGVPSLIDLLVFKRNHCIYILSYVGVKDAFAAHHSEFDRFLRGFRVP